MSIHDAVRAIFAESLSLPDDADIENLRYRETKSWDSLGHMQLVGALESHFDIMLETQDVLDMSSFTEAVKILTKYGVQAA